MQPELFTGVGRGLIQKRYVHQNPVKAGICDKAEEYTWSSWQEYLNDDGLLPTLCYTRAVLKRIPLEDLKGLVDEPLDGDITDVEYTTDDRLTDADYSSLLDMDVNNN